LLAPDSGSAEHLRVLARLSRTLRDPHQCAVLRNCPNGEALRLSLTDEADEQRAA
jgi:mannitol/fructose-specific phosphotransferase system IIA component (Ntr-type)